MKKKGSTSGPIALDFDLKEISLSDAIQYFPTLAKKTSTYLPVAQQILERVQSNNLMRDKFYLWGQDRAKNIAKPNSLVTIVNRHLKANAEPWRIRHSETGKLFALYCVSGSAKNVGRKKGRSWSPAQRAKLSKSMRAHYSKLYEELNHGSK